MLGSGVAGIPEGDLAEVGLVADERLESRVAVGNDAPQVVNLALEPCAAGNCRVTAR